MNVALSLMLNRARIQPLDYASEGYDFLVDNARVFHDFTQLSEAHGETITTSEDLTSNNRDLTNAWRWYVPMVQSFTT